MTKYARRDCMAIISRDGKKLVATVSQPGLFRFQNREYACIHCGTGFGEVKPGLTRLADNTSSHDNSR